jgi:hypothetical protein
VEKSKMDEWKLAETKKKWRVRKFELRCKCKKNKKYNKKIFESFHFGGSNLHIWFA